MHIIQGIHSRMLIMCLYYVQLQLQYVAKQLVIEQYNYS